MHPLGFLRATAICSRTTVADPAANREAIQHAVEQHLTSDILLFPELALTGYTCGELFNQQILLDRCLQELVELVRFTKDLDPLIVVGMPLRTSGRLFNVAAVIQRGQLLGLVPKQHLPTYQEFYEARWFHPGKWNTDARTVDLQELGTVPFGVDLLFETRQVTIGIEICEDLWLPIPPSSRQALAGATVLLNLSASNETIGKAEYRRQLIASQSGRCAAAYVYASSGPGESTTDLVFGGHCLIAEGGNILAESKRVGTGLVIKDGTSSVTADIDLARIEHDRQLFGTFHQEVNRTDDNAYRRIACKVVLREDNGPLQRSVTGLPFVPANQQDLAKRCREIFEIQCAGLAKRVQSLPSDSRLHIGVSGGLDSTLALLVAVRMCQEMGWPSTRIHGITMPGFGTSSETLANAKRLMQLLNVSSEQIDIRSACMEVFRDLKHAPLGVAIDDQSPDKLQLQLEAVPVEKHQDLTFENVQARVRTLMLMSRGFVLGTGDLSELALGWNTYNGDHMSMYNVNCSVPKTLVRFLVRYVAEHDFEGPIRDVLLKIVGTPITPELLPLSKTGAVQQSTESSIGKYELHDFFLYHFIRTGATPAKLLYLAQHASFENSYTDQELTATLMTFLKRFFYNQFKRSCVPDGPKVGTVSLSPRGDWRMPSDASVRAWLDE